MGEKHPYYALSINFLAYAYLHLGNYQEVSKYNTLSFTLAKNYILDNLGTMSQMEMETFLDKYKNLAARFVPTVAYDAELLNKGLTLTANIEIHKLIQQSGDAEAMKLLDEMKNNSRMRDVQLKKPISERTMDVDSLSQIINAQQKHLAEMSKAYGDYSKPFQLTWSDFRNNLKPGEAAVEFALFGKTDEIYALVLEPGYDEPIRIIIKLPFNNLDDEDEDERIALLSSKEKTAEMLQPLLTEIPGASVVYFSPAGVLHLMPIENVTDCGKKFVRLSSTREIALRDDRKQQPLNDCITAYGGLQYEENAPELLAENAIQPEEDIVYHSRGLMRSASNSGIDREAYGYLLGTLIEATKIDSLAKANGTQSRLLTHYKGTEGSVKALSGKAPRLLHIATHGIFEKFDKTNNTAAMSFLDHDQAAPRISDEEKALTHTGLLMSGGYAALSGTELPDNMEDGLLTAKEVSVTDLRGCDLVVMSACSTGLGNITDEGVFGLQRGFKKAGVNAILMSLWPVDDEATQMLMVEFYKHYLSGLSKQKSLEKAQQHVKSQRGFEDPKYWAGFVLLDALD